VFITCIYSVAGSSCDVRTSTPVRPRSVPDDSCVPKLAAAGDATKGIPEVSVRLWESGDGVEVVDGVGTGGGVSDLRRAKV